MASGQLETFINLTFWGLLVGFLLWRYRKAVAKYIINDLRQFWADNGEFFKGIPRFFMELSGCLVALIGGLAKMISIVLSIVLAVIGMIWFIKYIWVHAPV